MAYVKYHVKKIYNNHSKSFTNKSPDKDNKLSKYILLFKDNDKTPKISKQNATSTKTLVKDLLMSKFQWKCNLAHKLRILGIIIGNRE